MKITQVETLRLGEFPNILWVRLHTDEGLVGLGETFMGAQAVEAYLHEWAARSVSTCWPCCCNAGPSFTATISPPR